MLVKQAKEIARQWVMEEASQRADFYGAYFLGSINWMSDDALFPHISDVDVRIVTQGPNSPKGYKTFLYRGVMLEVSYVSGNDLQSPEVILANYHTACHFTRPSIIADPSGQLTMIQAIVARDYAKRSWVRKRCEHAVDWLRSGLDRLNEADPLHAQVFAWLYPTSIPHHVILVAALEHPTGPRNMFMASQETLAHYHQLPLHDSLLALLGSATLSQGQVEFHLARLAEVFDVAKTVVKTPFFGATGISDDARERAIEGSQTIIKRGYPREAIFWIAVNFTWCQTALFNDAPVELQHKFTPYYQHLLRDLGITAFADLQQRNQELAGLLPRIWEVVEDIMDRNPAIIS